MALFRMSLLKLARRPATWVVFAILAGLIVLVFFALGASAGSLESAGEELQVRLLLAFPTAYTMVVGVILGFAQAAKRRIDPSNDLSEPLASIEEEAKRCRHLVQDLLTFSRASRADRDPVDLNDAVGRALGLVRAQAKMKRVQIVENLSAEPIRVLANSNQLQQIVINLATNAGDAVGENGVVTLTTRRESQGTLSWGVLSVADNGPGIPKDLQSRILEPFFTTKEVGQGTGLGLSLVHELVKRHSGTLEVESAPGRTVFSIRFPIRDGSAERTSVG